MNRMILIFVFILVRITVNAQDYIGFSEKYCVNHLEILKFNTEKYIDEISGVRSVMGEKVNSTVIILGFTDDGKTCFFSAKTYFDKNEFTNHIKTLNKNAVIIDASHWVIYKYDAIIKVNLEPSGYQYPTIVYVLKENL